MAKKKNSRLKTILKASSPWKIILPTILGLAAVFYMMWKNFNYEEFLQMSWNSTTIFFIVISILVLIIRHLAYSWRLRIMSDKFFSWKKSIELIFIWEFASAISPTALGGSATALIFFAQEKLSGAKSVTIVLYSVVLDTLFFILSLLVFLIVLGPSIIRPEMTTMWDINGYGISFWTVLFVMTLYSSFFYYGLFINPKQLSRILIFLSKWRILKRFKKNISKTALDVVEVSSELNKKSPIYHLKAFASTAIAWTGKFAIIPLVVFGIIQTNDYMAHDFWLMFSRNETMFSITAFSPTPGGAGVVEALFGGFFKDYIIESAAAIIAFIWRILTYYSYLFAGIIVLPLWIQGILKRRRRK